MNANVWSILPLTTLSSSVLQHHLNHFIPHCTKQLRDWLNLSTPKVSDSMHLVSFKEVPVEYPTTHEFSLTLADGEWPWDCYLPTPQFGMVSKQCSVTFDLGITGCVKREIDISSTIFRIDHSKLHKFKKKKRVHKSVYHHVIQDTIISLPSKLNKKYSRSKMILIENTSVATEF